ncbi:MAG: amidohydrolase family protein [Erysipelotrichaceae bacterium]|nr:amidohydrolase family protein [Erysipelotrichaceae bacterium]
MAITVYRGNIVTSESLTKLKVIENGYVVVEDGIIKAVLEEMTDEYRNYVVRNFGDGIIIPAFSDLHMHAPQFTERGIGMDCLLFDWLNNFTFPQESGFRDIEYARKIYPQVIREFLRHGTFQVNLFSTIHYDSCDLLFKLLMESGMYAYSGKINMDSNSPDYYVESTEESISSTERFIVEHQGLSDKVKPIIIPRFAPTCSLELLKGLGELAGKYDVGLHTHLVESIAEAAWSKELFPMCASDGEIYEMTGLLQGNGPKIFAHVIFPTEVEERILKQYNCTSVHCPDATTNITAGIMPASKMLDNGYSIAIGSDVGGGHFTGIYRQISRAVQLSKMKEFYEEDYKRLIFAEAFYMATVNGGKVFGNIGKIEPGYKFNALVIDGMQDDGYKITTEQCVERFCYIGDDRNIVARFIDGQFIDPEEVYKRLIEKY